MKTIDDIVKFQKEFDSKHSSSYDWDAKIDDSNIHILEHLLLATLGELGEAANVLKKIIRGDRTFVDAKQDISDEVVDVFVYTIKLSYQLGIDLESEYFKKMQHNSVRFEKYER